MLKEKINQELKEAMKSKNIDKRNALRLLTSAFKQVEVDERKSLTEEDIISIIQKQIKTRNDSIEQYKKAQREDLIEIEQREINFYTPFLPTQLTEDELTKIIQEFIKSKEISSMKCMGQIMGFLTKSYKGLYNGKSASLIVKKLLS